jgi:hypothetical protein
MQKLFGFVVFAKSENGRYEPVSIPFLTRSGADSFMALYLKYHPEADCFVHEAHPGDKGKE